MHGYAAQQRAGTLYLAGSLALRKSRRTNLDAPIVELHGGLFFEQCTDRKRKRLTTKRAVCIKEEFLIIPKCNYVDSALPLAALVRWKGYTGVKPLQTPFSLRDVGSATLRVSADCQVFPYGTLAIAQH
eukprot:1145277-Pelagomonas_calceolata.AAC.2